MEALLDWYIKTDGNMGAVTSGTFFFEGGPLGCDLSDVLGFMSDFARILYALKSAHDSTGGDPLHMDIPTRCLALCAAMWSCTGRHEPQVKRTSTVLTSEVLKISIICASESSLEDSSIPLRPKNMQVWTVPTSNINWLVDFLDVLHGADSTLAESEVWDATAHAFLVIYHLRDLDTQIGNKGLIRALNWVLQVRRSEPWSSRLTTDPLYRLHCTISFIIYILTLKGDAAPLPHERYALLQTGVEDFPGSWCSLQAAVASSDDSDCYEEFACAVAAVAESAPEATWINEPDNEICVRHWVGAVGRRMDLEDASRLLGVKVDKLLICKALFDSTDPYWQSHQVRRVAMAALYLGWWRYWEHCEYFAVV